MIRTCKACSADLSPGNRHGICTKCIRAANRAATKHCQICDKRLKPTNATGYCIAHVGNASERKRFGDYPIYKVPAARREEYRTLMRKGWLARDIADWMVHGKELPPSRRADDRAARPVPEVTVYNLILAAERVTLISRADICGQGRFQPMVRARQAVMYLAARAGHSFSSISYRLGKKDHTTAIHGKNVAAELIHRDPDFAAMVNRISELAPRRTAA